MSRRRIGLLLCVVLGLLCLAQARLVRAQTPDPNDQVYAVAKRLNCPTCGGRNLADCPTDTCTQWKNEIRAQLQAGKSPQQVIDFFKDRFGPTVLQEPPKEGAVLVLWVLPVLGLVALAAGGVVVLRRVTRQGNPSADKVLASIPTAPADNYVQRLEEEVRSS
jgi:cytochrome c-type biogenesis protein CcmH